METIPEEICPTGEDWQKKCLEQLRSEAKDALSEILLKDDKEEGSLPKTGKRASTSSNEAANIVSPPKHPQPPSKPPTTADFPPDNDERRNRRYTTALTGARKFIRKSRKQRSPPIDAGRGGTTGGGVRGRAYTTAAPADTARQVSAISVEFQKLLEQKTAELRAQRERGQLTDQQLEEQFMADIGAALRRIADDFREMNQKKAAEMKQQEDEQKQNQRQERGRNGGPPPSRFMQAVRSASGRMIALFTNT